MEREYGKVQTIAILVCALALTAIAVEFGVWLVSAPQPTRPDWALGEEQIQRIVEESLSKRMPREPQGVFGQMMGRLSRSLREEEAREDLRNMLERMRENPRLKEATQKATEAARELEKDPAFQKALRELMERVYGPDAPQQLDPETPADRGTPSTGETGE